MLFLVAVLEEPLPKDEDDGALPKLCFGPEPIIAKDDKAAGYQVIMNKKIEVDPSRMRVLVRPF